MRSNFLCFKKEIRNGQKTVNLASPSKMHSKWEQKYFADFISNKPVLLALGFVNNLSPCFRHRVIRRKYR